MSRRLLVTGGAGFIGTNMAARRAAAGDTVVILDDLSRRGVDSNLGWLLEMYGDSVLLERGDINDHRAVRRALAGVDEVFHFAAQVAVTTSVDKPRTDFEVNLSGTLTLLEELRRLDSPPPLLFTSTNKVYGGLEDVAITKNGERYEPEDPEYRRYGISERRPLEFCSPYGCSKGGADQYVVDYAKSYGLRTLVFRMSCIYGPHQQGNEDQGWVAHFAMKAMADEPITLYGDGCQVRDVLYVDDLLDAMEAGIARIDLLSGRAFNMGGGPASTVSLLELLELIEELEGRRPSVGYGDWRIGDQRWYVSDTRAFQQATGWKPKVAVREGVAQLHAWLRGSRAHLAEAKAS